MCTNCSCDLGKIFDQAIRPGPRPIKKLSRVVAKNAGVAPRPRHDMEVKMGDGLASHFTLIPSIVKAFRVHGIGKRRHQERSQFQNIRKLAGI